MLSFPLGRPGESTDLDRTCSPIITGSEEVNCVDVGLGVVEITIGIFRIGGKYLRSSGGGRCLGLSGGEGGDRDEDRDGVEVGMMFKTGTGGMESD